MSAPDHATAAEIIDTPTGRLLVLPTEGVQVTTPAQANDLIGEVWGQDATWLVVPQERFADEFFRLRSGLAGEVAQKFANYRLGLIILGDITRHLEISSALRDFVRECNAGRQLWFVRDRAELDERLRSLPT